MKIIFLLESLIFLGACSGVVDYIEDLPEGVAATAAATPEIPGKSIQILQRTISLLKLTLEIRTAISLCCFL